MDKESIFAEALTKQTPRERQQFLEAACGENAELRVEIEDLLAAHDDAGSFLNKTPKELVATADSGQSHPDDVDNDAWRELLMPSDDPQYLGTLGQYEVVELLGRGGFGVVLQAHDSKLHRIVAIKLLAPQLALTPTAVQRFLREARAAAAVSHDHVVAIHSINDVSRPPMIVMEYVDGQSLQQKVDNTGALDLKSILRIGMQTASGLEAAHRQGLVHRDIKPANILLENGIERVKLTDFGLARAVDDIGMTQTGQITGTPQYMSPEQAQGQHVDHRTDLFSLGCVLYAMCTGRAAFRADSAVAVLHRVVHDTPRSIRELNEDIPGWLCEIVEKLLEKAPEDRFQSAGEVGDLLGRHLAHLQQPESVPQPDALGHPGPGAVEREVLPLLRQSMVRAIRAYRKRTGAGLAESRRALDEMARRHGIAVPMLTPPQRAMQIALGALGVIAAAILAAATDSWGAPPMVSGTILVGAALVYLVFLLAMWRGHRTAHQSRHKYWFTGALALVLAGIGSLEFFEVTQFTHQIGLWFDDDGLPVLNGGEAGTEMVDESQASLSREYPRTSEAGDPVTQSPAHSRLGPDVLDDSTPIARLLGKPVYRRDCQSQHLSMPFEMGLQTLVVAVLEDEYCQAQQIDVAQEDIDAFAVRWKELQGPLLAQRRRELSDRLVSPDVSDEEATRLRFEREQLSAVASPSTWHFDAETEQQRLANIREKVADETIPWLDRVMKQRAERRQVRLIETKSWLAAEAYAQLLPLHCQKALYDQYGGKVVAFQLSLSPIGAYSELIREAENDGRLEFLTDDVREGFWKQMDREMSRPEVRPDAVTFRWPGWMVVPSDGGQSAQ